MKRAVIAVIAVLCSLLLGVNLSHADIKTGLVAYYPFNGNANDESGYGNNGIVYGATLTEDRSGNTNGSYHFDGVDDYIHISDSDNLDQTSNFTLSLWIESEFNGTKNTILNKHKVGTDRDGSWSFALSSGDLDFKASPYFSDGNEGGDPSVAEWHHIAFTFEKSTSKWTLYVDGSNEESGNKAFAIKNTSLNMFIGAEQGATMQNFFMGAIDDVRIYNRALSADEITELHLFDDSPAAPSAPTSVNASDGSYTDKVYVSWDAANSASTYDVYRSTSSDSTTATKLGSTSSTSYNDTSATAGTIYYYWVKACNSSGSCSGFSTSDSGQVRSPPTPSAPTGVTASDGTYTYKVNVTWSSASGASSYEVYRGTSTSSASSSKLTTTSSTNYSDTSATTETTYYYWVKACNSSGSCSSFSSNYDSGYSAKKTRTVPSASTSISASDGAYTDKVYVTWNSSPGAKSYSVFRGTSTSISSATRLTKTSSPSYSDTSATAGTTYYYWVKACNSAGTCSSADSSDTGYRATSITPTAPTSVAASDGTYTDKVYVTWGSVTGASTYDVYRGTSSSSSSASKLTGTSSTSYNDTSATAGTTYYYWVKACNSAGSCSSFSSSDTGYRSTSSTGTGSVSPAISAGHFHSMALASDGLVWTWGYNQYGQTGRDAATSGQETPAKVAALSSIKAIDGGYNSSLALKTDGTVLAMGRNSSGELGTGTTTSPSSPQQVTGLSDVQAISATAYHSMALKTDGSVWAWGWNHNGILGNGTTTMSTSPVQVTGLSSVQAIGPGDSFSMALKSDGTVWTWGNNRLGSLGNGTTTDSYTPIQVTSLSGVKAISGGYGHAMALKTDGTVWTWGYNIYGALGNGTSGNSTNSSLPVQVTGLSSVQAISAGYEFSVALKTDGTVWTWGANSTGQLGNDTKTNSSTPVQVSGLSGIQSISAGKYHVLAMKPDGTVWAWGANSWGGELGNTQAGTGSKTPVQVMGENGSGYLNLGSSQKSAARKTDQLTLETAVNTSVSHELVSSGGLDAIYTLMTPPSSGSVAMDIQGAFTYTPDLEFTGTDGFTYEILDSEDNRETGSVTILVR